ncbi:MAG: CopG family transcriptional regulator, partial [Halobacteriaceae archaeon]
PKSFVREHERLELEAEHLREQLEEHKQYINTLRDELEEQKEDVEDVIHLDDLDTDDEPYQLN